MKEVIERKHYEIEKKKIENEEKTKFLIKDMAKRTAKRPAKKPSAKKSVKKEER